MPTLTIRNLPEDVYNRLRTRAATNRRSMEAEARDILSTAALPTKESVAQAIRNMQELVSRLPPEAQEKISVDSFLAERRKMWGEDD